MQAADSAKTAAERHAELDKVIDAAEREPHAGLRGQLYVNLRARRAGLNRAQEARLDALGERVLPPSPAYQQWDLGRGLEVRHYVHEEFWAETLASYRAHGFHRVTAGVAGGGTVMEKELVDPAGAHPSVKARIVLRKDEVDLFRDAGDARVQMIIYSGHSALGANVSMSAEGAPKPRGSKLVQLYMCRGTQNLEEIRRHFGDGAHVVTTMDPSYNDADDRRLFAMYDTIARRGTYAAVRRLAGAAETRYLYPDDPRKLELVDADRDGVSDGGCRTPRTVDLRFNTGRRAGARGGRDDLVARRVDTPVEQIDGHKLTRAVAFANTVLTYHAEDTSHPRYRAAEVKDRFVAAGWFAGPPEEITRVGARRGGGGTIGVAVNARYSGQSRDALGALVVYDLTAKLAARHGASDRREQVLRPYLFASLYVHYMTAASDVADRVLSNLARRVGLPGSLTYGTMERIMAHGDDGYASDRHVRAFERLLDKRPH